MVGVRLHRRAGIICRNFEFEAQHGHKAHLFLVEAENPHVIVYMQRHQTRGLWATHFRRQPDSDPKTPTRHARRRNSQHVVHGELQEATPVADVEVERKIWRRDVILRMPQVIAARSACS